MKSHTEGQAPLRPSINPEISREPRSRTGLVHAPGYIEIHATTEIHATQAPRRKRIAPSPAYAIPRPEWESNRNYIPQSE
jgi:hypothetical protein